MTDRIERQAAAMLASIEGLSQEERISILNQQSLAIVIDATAALQCDMQRFVDLVAALHGIDVAGEQTFGAKLAALEAQLVVIRSQSSASGQ